MGQFFLSDIYGPTDKFGGSVENCTRFSLLVQEHIRKNVGNNFLVGMRISVYEDRGGPSS
ncbi:MAG: 2,4-dienoyl-CoA reductase-like NADH-dependent reductase (Old Yellow Enzyme family) [Candidatus Endobugula sp.]|jgi:2,4-dienoyl-CoA reductase-like NADH-dependent reductase (Old Yellow Enzyme family)